MWGEFYCAFGGLHNSSTQRTQHAPADDDVVPRACGQAHSRREARVAAAAAGVVVAGKKPLRRLARRRDDYLGVEIGLFWGGEGGFEASRRQIVENDEAAYIRKHKVSPCCTSRKCGNLSPWV